MWYNKRSYNCFKKKQPQTAKSFVFSHLKHLQVQTTYRRFHQNLLLDIKTKTNTPPLSLELSLKTKTTEIYLRVGTWIAHQPLVVRFLLLFQTTALMLHLFSHDFSLSKICHCQLFIPQVLNYRDNGKSYDCMQKISSQRSPGITIISYLRELLRNTMCLL